MGQSSNVARTGTRRVLRPLRALLMLTGFVAVWWCLSAGTAQADDGHHGLLRDTTRAVTGTLEKAVKPVQHEARRATQTPAHPVVRVTQTVRHHVAPVVSGVREAVRRTPLAPVVKTATVTVRTELEPVVDETREILDAASLDAVVVPELEVPSSDPSTPAGEESSAVQHAGQHTATLPTPSNSNSTPSVSLSLSPGLHTVTASHPAPETARPMVSSSSPLAPAGSPFGGALTGVSGPAGASSAPSGPGSTPAAGLGESTFQHTPRGLTTVHVSSADRLSAGPAYPPSSSPD